jgi:hypothetical protein
MVRLVRFNRCFPTPRSERRAYGRGRVISYKRFLSVYGRYADVLLQDGDVEVVE